MQSMNHLYYFSFFFSLFPSVIDKSCYISWNDLQFTSNALQHLPVSYAVCDHWSAQYFLNLRKHRFIAKLMSYYCPLFLVSLNYRQFLRSNEESKASGSVLYPFLKSENFSITTFSYRMLHNTVNSQYCLFLETLSTSATLAHAFFLNH